MSRIKQTFIILTPGFPDNESDTNCLPVQQAFVRHLQKVQPYWHIIILSFQYPYEYKTYSWFGNTVICYNGRNHGGISRILLRRRIEGTLYKIINSAKVAGMLSFWYGECAWVGEHFAKRNGLRHYCWIFGQDARKSNHYPRKLKMNSSKLIALSEFLKDEFERNNHIRPAHLIPLGIEEMIDSKPQPKTIDILAAGSLIPLKNYELFIEILEKLKQTRPDIKAKLIGNGPDKKKLLELVRKSGLEDNLELTGELPHPEVLELMRKSKIFLHPSTYEGFSGVCLEALSAGAQVISFCRPMNHEIANWHFVGSTEEMKCLASRLLDDPIEVYPSFPYTMKATVDSILELYPSIENVEANPVAL